MSADDEQVTPEQVRYALDAEEALAWVREFTARGEPELAALQASIASGSAVLASLPAAVWRAARVRRELERRGLVARGQTLTEPGEARPGGNGRALWDTVLTRPQVPTPLDLERARQLRRLRDDIREDGR